MNLTRIISIKEKLVIGQMLAPDERDFALECINFAIERAAAERIALIRTTERHDAPNYLGRIDQLWAFLSLDDGGEGVCAAPLGNSGITAALVAADKRRVDSLIPIAREVASMFKKPVRLAKFKQREDVEIYLPE
jgi:hypothetical protein